MTVKDINNQLSKVVKKVMQGETVQILDEQDNKPFAMIEPITKKRRIPGLYSHLGPFTGVDNGKISLEEFLGVDSLDEVEPLP